MGKFELGTVKVCSAASHVLAETCLDLEILLAGHQDGDWGNVENRHTRDDCLEAAETAGFTLLGVIDFTFAIYLMGRFPSTKPGFANRVTNCSA